mgnify:CR=1 FL=1
MSEETLSNNIGHPVNIGTLHFVGIGGIGMSGIAEVMHNFGYKIQGSDISENANVLRLRKLGIKVFVGQCAENLEGAWGIVISTAIQPDNPEVVAARALKMPLIRRAEMLAELMRLKWCVSVAGTHGKTTTTTMVSAVLDEAKYDPTVINGGIINAYGTNARLGAGDWMVVEADESDGTFIKIPSTVAVVTNIDPEHLDFYGDFENAKAAFETFVENVPFYGFSVMCIDHPEVQALRGRIEDRRIVTYGSNRQADVQFRRVEAEGPQSRFDVTIRDRRKETEQTYEGLILPMPGIHNVSNATAAIAVAHELGVDEQGIREGLLKFQGVKRRFTHTGTWNGVEIFDDYAHHPVEISAVLKAARTAVRSAGDGKVIAIKQPHRYTRLRDLFDEFGACFNDADTVMVAPVYPAGEEPIAGFNSDTLVSAMKSGGHRGAMAIEGPDNIAGHIAQMAEPGDYVIFLGAGNITAWAHALPDELAAMK